MPFTVAVAQRTIIVGEVEEEGMEAYHQTNHTDGLYLFVLKFIVPVLPHSAPLPRA